MSVYATIDIGTNSMKLFVGAVGNVAFDSARSARPLVRPIDEALVVTRLGEGLAETGRLSESAIQRNLNQLAALTTRARAAGAQEIAVVGTMALREASNAASFLARAQECCEVTVEIIPGETEARLAFLGILSGLEEVPSGPVCAFDTGGGSTEFMLGEGRTLQDHFSINLGVRAPTERYLRSDPPHLKELSELRLAIADFLAPVAGRIASRSARRLIGLGGTVTTLAAVRDKMTHYDPSRIRGTFLKKKEVERQIQIYARLPLSQKKQIEGLEPERADIILTGACIVAGILEALREDRLEVNERGLRHGLFLDRFLPIVDDHAEH